MTSPEEKKLPFTVRLVFEIIEEIKKEKEVGEDEKSTPNS